MKEFIKYALATVMTIVGSIGLIMLLRHEWYFNFFGLVFSFIITAPSILYWYSYFDNVFKENQSDTNNIQKIHHCGRCGKLTSDDIGEYCNKFHSGDTGMFCRGKIQELK